LTSSWQRQPAATSRNDVTPGRRDLLAVLQRTRQEFVADTCGVTRAEVSRWATGDRTPSEASRGALFRRYGIPRDSWVPPKRSPGSPRL
jgi:transcriptional regulator with XRE-family HTH domain